jgi:CHAT domain-containing protein
VLSACETGLCEVAGGEGVFGLQRAFGLAGSRTVVASLWKVDDSATHALMVEFYRNLWEQKLGKLESLRQAQLAMIRRYDPKRARMSEPRGLTLTTKDRREPTLAPFHWAAFTLSGDWR